MRNILYTQDYSEFYLSHQFLITDLDKTIGAIAL
jgi:hypothetical protein